MKLATQSLNVPTSTPLQTPLRTPGGCVTDMMHMVGDIIGRKVMARLLYVSKTLVDQWISGEKANFLSRTHDLILILVDHKANDVALAILNNLAEPLGAAVLSRQQVAMIQDLAKQCGAQIKLDEWENK